MGLSVIIALIIVWAAIALSYSTNYPVGFFVGTISAACYAVGRAWTACRRRVSLRDTPGRAPAPSVTSSGLD
jgi:zinc/manganese transport system permease protein